jgi:hypothetical protein
VLLWELSGVSIWEINGVKDASASGTRLRPQRGSTAP